MSNVALEEQIKSIDLRLTRVEQILPTLATKVDLEPLATKAELRELREEMVGLIEVVRAEGEAGRRHSLLLYEDLRDDIRLVLDHVLVLSTRVDALARRS